MPVNIQAQTLTRPDVHDFPLNMTIRSKLSKFNITPLNIAQPELNNITKWKLVINSISENATRTKGTNKLTLEDIKISGGMPKHAHGLPTTPMVTKLTNLSDGAIEIEISGLKFHMWGHWFIGVSIPKLSDKAELHFNLSPKNNL